jgi:glucose/arabinose dehydrogenase
MSGVLAGMRLVAVAALAIGVFVSAASGSPSATRGFTQVVGGLDTPVDVRFAPGDSATMYVVEQRGDIKMIRNGAVAGTFLDIHSKVRSGGEQGLLSMVFHPSYAQNHLFYVSYTDTNGDSRIVQYRSSNGVGVPSSAKQLLFVHQPYSNHNGGDLQFDKKGYLYIGFGDGGSEDDPGQTSENPSTRLGKLLRTNPLRGGGWQMVGLGLRNPWRYSFDSTGNLWIGDVGQNTYEEIDYRSASRVGRLANYGWSRYEGKSTFSSSHRLTHKGDLVFPVLTYTHQHGCSVTGGYVTHGRYYYGDYCAGTIWSFKAGNGRKSAAVAVGNVGSPSSFGLGPDGTLYVTSLGGSIYKLG